MAARDGLRCCCILEEQSESPHVALSASRSTASKSRGVAIVYKYYNPTHEQSQPTSSVQTMNCHNSRDS